MHTTLSDNTLTWLHLSDWHQKGADFDRRVVRDALIRDIQDRASIDNALQRIDLVIISGDLAFSGKDTEYVAAAEYLLEPIREATQVDKERFFIVPGNHDVDRSMFDLLPAPVTQPFGSKATLDEWLTNDKKRSRLLEPFEAFDHFVRDYCQLDTSTCASYAQTKRLRIRDAIVELIGLNSALMTARVRNTSQEFDDFGKLIVGEPQVHDILSQNGVVDLRIAVVHHPFDWLWPLDRRYVERRLGEACHFVLRGHEHVPEVHVQYGTAGNVVIRSCRCVL
jgi:predicted phosphodiesterase